MREDCASRTALITSLMRAIHSRFDPDPLIQDLWADRLVSLSERTTLLPLASAGVDAEIEKRLSESGSLDPVLDAALHGRATYPGVIIRTRYTEAALRGAVGRGVRQYLIIGAGLDSFALRQPRFARNLEIYELDHPATQEFKRRRLAECDITLPSNVHLIPADLAHESLGAVLGRSSFQADRPAFVSLLGVTLYLSREVNLATFRTISAVAAAGSEVVFTYVDQCEIDAAHSSGSFGKVQISAASLGEPWVSGFEPTRLGDDLRETGLTLLEDLNGEQMHERYGKGRVDILRPKPTTHIAHARVV